MVYGAIDENSREYYTYLKEVFHAINDKQMEFNWLITDSEIFAHSEALDALNTGANWQYGTDKTIDSSAPIYSFLSGEELTKIVSQDNSQWIWGVLSGFKKTIPLEDILQYPLPEAESVSFWKNPLSIQHPLATIEIVPWDSSLVLVLSKDKEIVDHFRAAFPKCRDLYEYNA